MLPTFQKCAGEPPVNEEWTCFTCRGIQHPQMLYSSEFSLEDAQADAINMIELSIKHLMEDSAMKLNPEFGKTVTLCLSNLENPKLRSMESVKNVCSNIITEIWPSIVTSDEKAMLNCRFENKTALFHKIRSAPSMILKMKELFKVLEVPNGAMTMFILQFLLPKLFQVLIKKRTKEMPTAEPEKVFKLDRTEEQVLRYTAGYVCRKLSRHFKRYPRNDTAKVCAEIVDSFHKSSITRTYNFLSYTKQWIDLINRGGVYEINDDVFIFFRRMELVVRQYLNDSDASLSVSKDILEKKI
ncbi:unnamed protein product [Mytilus edulis]|uniref:Uncharacterized protein n=1 Tax=Mytilus edulis TaxID=6550 RepID=A0A8S3TXI4_MYTED|nr:unnamed protein product [Mytilus edulis]